MKEKHCHRVSICEGKFDRLPTLMAEIVRLGADVIASHGRTTTRIA
jgi:hypothetical protein